MAARKMTNDDKREFAYLLYVHQGFNQKTCAEKAGVTPKTLGNWVEKYNWEKERKRLLIGKQEQLNKLYDQLDNLTQVVEKSEDGYPSPQQADTMIKISTAIRNMETDLAIADIVESGMKFMRFLQSNCELEETKATTELWNSFVQHTIQSA